jgi:long-chain fatty acid transport protein
MKRGTNSLNVIANRPRPKADCVARRFLRLAIIGTLVFTSARSWAEGFRNPPPGAFDLGRAGGRIAQVDDSSAAAQNPANLVDLTGLQFQLSPTVVYIHADYTSPTGQSAQSTDPWKFLPNAFVAAPLADGKMGLGLAVTTPYGLGSQWDQNSSAFAAPSGIWRYQTPFSTELTTVNVSPGFAAKLGENVRLGAALDVMWSELKLKQYYPWALVTFPIPSQDGQINASGDGVGVGGNFGLTVQLTERQRLAVTARTPINIDYNGSFQVDNVPPVLGGGSLNSDFSTAIKFPTTVAAGYGIELTDQIRLEADFEWLQFSRFQTLPLNISSPPPGLPASVAENWKDTFTAGFGGDWRFATNWVVRAGYQFYESPVPDSTFSPTIPDANQNVITVGLGYSYKGHSFEVAYGADFYKSRTITSDANPAFDGKYNFTVHLFSFAYRYTF